MPLALISFKLTRYTVQKYATRVPPLRSGSVRWGFAGLRWPWLGFAVRLLFTGSAPASMGPSGVIVPPLAVAAPGPRFAPPLTGSTPGGSSTRAPPPRFSSAPPGTHRDSGSEDNNSNSSSTSAAPVSSATLLAELVYDFCLEARPVSDSAPPPRCGFEAWFDPYPASSSSRPRFRVYPRVDEVVSEVADRAAVLHRRSKPLSAILPHEIRRYAVADQPLFTAPLPVSPSFSRLAGVAAVGCKRWGSVTFAEMERLERFFRCQLEATSSSIWRMSGILAMLKRDGFNPSTPGLFDTAIASVSASLAFQARLAASGSAFLCSKRRESLLALWTALIPEPQKRALVVTTGSVSGLFDEPLLDSMAAQVKEDSLVFSSLAVSKALSSCSGSEPLATSSSPLASPSGYRPPCPAQRSGKRSASSSRSGGCRHFKGGKRSAPSSNPSGFRKLVPSPCLTLSDGCLSLHWQAWRDRGADPWVVEVLREGCRIPFLRPPLLSTDPIPMP